MRFLGTICPIGKDSYSSEIFVTILFSLNDMSLSVLPEDFGLLTNLTSLELRENLIKVKHLSVVFFKNDCIQVYLKSVASRFRGCQKKNCPKVKLILMVISQG
jgi:hypothetical protein